MYIMSQNLNGRHQTHVHNSVKSTTEFGVFLFRDTVYVQQSTECPRYIAADKCHLITLGRLCDTSAAADGRRLDQFASLSGS